MGKWKYICLLYCIYSSIGKIRAQTWESPPFLEPVPLDVGIQFWEFSKPLDAALIELFEEVEHNVTIAVVNYKGDEKPRIDKFEDKTEINSNLGAKFDKNEQGNWIVVVTRKQDFETPAMQKYTMTIALGEETHKIKIAVINIDDNPPVIQANERSCSVPENYEGLTNCTFTITDVDGWIDKTTFNITSMPTSGSEHFLMEPKIIPSTQLKMNATLNVIKNLDFESIAVYTLGITATDSGNNTSNNLVTVVRVIDMPDMPPVWTNLTSAITIWEKSINTLSVSAIDGDYEINADINYKIEVTEKNDNEFFEVEKETGLITINEIDRDTLKKEIFKFTIIAYEVENITSSINSTIVVVVNDMNDHIPEISPSNLSIDILEETYMNLNFSEQIVIIDPDLAENAQYDVTLEKDPIENWDSAFLIIPNSGYQLGNFTISVVNADLLDYEDENWRNINIKIVATERANPAHIGTRYVKINLINWNDELPIFENDNMVVNVAEDVEKGFPVATVLAKDRDVNDTVRHSLVTQRNLQIDSATGEITTTEDKSFDYESMPIVLVQVIATDDANHTTYATLTVNVTDVNDKPPSLFLPQVKPTLVEEVDVGTEVKTKIYASDPDTEAELKFSIDWDSSTAYKSSSPANESLYREHLIIKTIYPEGKKKYAEALLVVSRRIDYEEFDVMYLTIVVTDVTTVHNEDSASSSLTLLINDINDNPPEFEEPEEMRVLENQKSGILIGKVTAHDIDGPGNNEVTYSIIPINGTKDELVQIDPKTGIIKVEEYAGIDAEEYEYLYYNVSATDSVHNTILPIEIYVIDENDESPTIPPDKFNSTIHIKEKSENGTEIVPVYAFDKDRTSPFNNVSYSINTDYPQLFQYFSMGKFDGWLKVNLIDKSTKLDRDFGQSNFSVFLRLRDNNIDVVGYPSNMITEMITVILDDINDQIPKLPNLSKATSISEETETDVKVLTVTADDRDDPNSVNTKVFYEIKEVVKADDKMSNLTEDCPILFKVKTIKKKYAEISTNCHLKGYYGIWSLKLYVTDLGVDPGPLNHTKIYNISITDYNYNYPEIVYPVAGKLIRLSRIQQINSQLHTHDGQLLENFYATDKDYGESGVVTFTISHGVELFKIVPLGNNSGQLQLNSIPNFNLSHTFELIIAATDNGEPKQKTATQTQKIIFISTEGPEFTTNTFKAEFHENTTGLNEFLIIPQAYDMINEGIQDDSTVDIYYFFANEDDDMSYFELDKETRNLTLKKQLDREEKDTMSILVIATTNRNGPTSNPHEKATLNITIIVLDVNDNPPNFENKDYFGGVALEDAVGKVVLTVKATDADLNDSLSYSIIDQSLTISHNSLEGISVPFKIEISTGELLLDFKTTSYMTGYFSFDILVQDEVLHEDKTHVQVYIIAQNNRVTFTFKNKITDLNDKRSYVIKAFTEIFGYVCNIDYLEKNNFARDVQSDDITVLTAHFINADTNLPVQADIITLAANDLETITNLKASLLTKNLYLVDVPTSSSITATEDLHDVIQWVLICLTTFFFILSIALLVAYIVRIRGLTEKLDKMAITNYGSHDSGLDKIGIMPNSNKFALEGSNPMWKTEPVNVAEDNISRGSGDSDLIGIEDNPDFDYDQNSKALKNAKFNTFVLPESTAFPVGSLVENEKSKKDEFSC